jgi:hypothetical protein
MSEPMDSIIERKRQIQLHETAIKDLRAACNHVPQKLRSYRCNSEWDQFAHYQADYECRACGERWSESDD